MKLEDALKDLAELSPNRIRRFVERKHAGHCCVSGVWVWSCVFSQLGRSTGECDVPSQPFLEWLCLKVLGAGHLMSCSLSRCSRAFTYPSQHPVQFWDDPSQTSFFSKSREETKLDFQRTCYWSTFQGRLFSSISKHLALLTFFNRTPFQTNFTTW